MQLSIWHGIIIVGVVLLLFGPSRLPNLARSFGESIRGFKKGLKGEIDARDVTPLSDEEKGKIEEKK